MKFTDCLDWGLTYYDTSCVKVYCKSNISKKLSKSFMDLFKTSWKIAQDYVLEQYGDYNEFQDLPVSTEVTDYGFIIHVDQLEIRYNYGDYYEPSRGWWAFEDALKTMMEVTGKVKEISDIKYVGYIGYVRSDVLDGQAVQKCYSYGIQTDGNYVYDFVGEQLAEIFAEFDGEYSADFREQVRRTIYNDDYEDVKQTIDDLYAYSEWINKDDLQKGVEWIISVANASIQQKLRNYVEGLK